jgi:hypothetical protein
MGKLWNLKRWLPLAQAAAHLAQLMDEEHVSEADLLHLALEHQLQLSVIFPDGVLAQRCSIVDPASVAYSEMPSIDGERTIRVPEDGRLIYDRGGNTLQANGRVTQLDDDEPYDLAMLGGEREDVLRAFWAASGAPVQETSNLDGTFVSLSAAHEPTYFCLVDEFKDSDGVRSYFPMGELPESAVFVVRQSELRRLAQSFEAEPPASALPPNRWPWGTHHTELLGHLDAAARRFWLNFDPTDRTTAPTNEAVSDWLVSRGVSRRTADTMASILRADGLPTGPRTS